MLGGLSQYSMTRGLVQRLAFHTAQIPDFRTWDIVSVDSQIGYKSV